jgi:hypothetical protein
MGLTVCPAAVGAAPVEDPLQRLKQASARQFRHATITTT